MKIQKMFITPNEYSRPQTPLNKVRGLVIHWYADPMASAIAVRNFFENRKNGKSGYGSAQYNIGLQGEIIQNIPENEMAYGVGSKTYAPIALKKLSSYPNNCVLNIECAHVDWTGKMTDATYFSLVELTVDIMKRHELSVEDLWLHQEVVLWKDCHRWFVNNQNEWVTFKKQIDDLLNKKVKPTVKSEVIKPEKSPVAQTPSKPTRDADVLYLPPTYKGEKNDSWAMYHLDKEPKRETETNIKLELNPYKYNGLKYEILGEHPKYPNVVKIKSQQKGEGWIYVGSETGAQIIKGEAKKAEVKHTPKPKKEVPKSSIKPIGEIEIIEVSNAAYIQDRPDKNTSKILGTIGKGARIAIAGSVIGKNNHRGYWEVIYKGERAYISGQFGKQVK